MGWENRDYARNYSAYESAYGSNWPPVCKFIIVANVVIFLMQIFSSRPITREEFIEKHSVNEFRLPEEWAEQIGDQAGYLEQIKEMPDEQFRMYASQFGTISPVQEALSIDSRKILQGQVWRCVSGAFCHSRFNLMHILINMLMLYMFGITLEKMYGSREFALFYFVATVASSLACVGLDLWTKNFVPAIGASGAVMAVIVLFAIHFPRQQILFCFIIPIEIRYLVWFYVLYDLHPLLLQLADIEVATGVAHAGHLGGMAFGFLYWHFQLRLEQFLPRSTQTNRSSGRKQAPVTIKMFVKDDSELDQHEEHVSEGDDFDREVDRLLRKLKSDGIENLSAKEKELLVKASEWYKNREKL